MAVRTRDPGLGLDTAVAQVPANRNTLDEFGVDETVAADEDADLRSGDGGERDGE